MFFVVFLKRTKTDTDRVTRGPKRDGKKTRKSDRKQTSGGRGRGHKTRRSDRGRDEDGDGEARKLWCWFLMGVNFEGDPRGRLDTVV